MSREVILKYLTEFNAWVKGQEVYVMFSNGGHRLVDSLEDFNEDVKYIVLKDSYFFYRKALAEGKTIEYLGQSSNVWHEIPEPDFILHLTCYRIKPDEPKFKVGDFVRYIHTTYPRALEINNINEGRYYFINSEMSCLKHELEPWTPIKGEWCWFFNDDRIPTISQFVEMDNDITRKYFAVYPNRPKALGSWYKKCEPFLNSLPSYLKDK